MRTSHRKGRRPFAVECGRLVRPECDTNSSDGDWLNLRLGIFANHQHQLACAGILDKIALRDLGSQFIANALDWPVTCRVRGRQAGAENLVRYACEKHNRAQSAKTYIP